MEDEGFKIKKTRKIRI